MNDLNSSAIIQTLGDFKEYYHSKSNGQGHQGHKVEYLLRKWAQEHLTTEQLIYVGIEPIEEETEV